MIFFCIKKVTLTYYFHEIKCCTYIEIINVQNFPNNNNKVEQIQRAEFTILMERGFSSLCWTYELQVIKLLVRLSIRFSGHGLLHLELITLSTSVLLIPRDVLLTSSVASSQNPQSSLWKCWHSVSNLDLQQQPQLDAAEGKLRSIKTTNWSRSWRLNLNVILSWFLCIQYKMCVSNISKKTCYMTWTTKLPAETHQFVTDSNTHLDCELNFIMHVFTV